MHNDEAQELLADFRRLSEENPSLATTYTIGNSVLGQTLQVVLEMSGPIVNRDQSESVKQVIQVISGADRDRKQNDVDNLDQAF